MILNWENTEGLKFEGGNPKFERSAEKGARTEEKTKWGKQKTRSGESGWENTGIFRGPLDAAGWKPAQVAGEPACATRRMG